MNWSSPRLKCLLFSFDAAATHCDTTRNMGEASVWRRNTKPQRWKEKEESRSIWLTTGRHMWPRFCHLPLWNSLWSICECFANPNLHFCLKIEVFLSHAAKIKNKEVQTGARRTGIEIRTKRVCLEVQLIMQVFLELILLSIVFNFWCCAVVYYHHYYHHYY